MGNSFASSTPPPRLVLSSPSFSSRTGHFIRTSIQVALMLGNTWWLDRPLSRPLNVYVGLPLSGSNIMHCICTDVTRVDLVRTLQETSSRLTALSRLPSIYHDAGQPSQRSDTGIQPRSSFWTCPHQPTCVPHDGVLFADESIFPLHLTAMTYKMGFTQQRR